MTSPEEWRKRLDVLIESYTRFGDVWEKLPSWVRDHNAEVSSYLGALAREWDAHEPEGIPPAFQGEVLWRKCHGCNYLVDADDPAGLCPARRRIMGEAT